MPVLFVFFENLQAEVSAFEYVFAHLVVVKLLLEPSVEAHQTHQQAHTSVHSV